MKFRKKPVVIEAVQWTDETEMDVAAFIYNVPQISMIVGEINGEYPRIVDIRIETLEGFMSASKGDYIIKGVNGEYYPCKPDIFEKTYDKVDVDSNGNPIFDKKFNV